MYMIVAMRHLILEIIALFIAGAIIGGAAARSVLDRRSFPRRRWDSSGIFSTDRHVRKNGGGS